MINLDMIFHVVASVYLCYLENCRKTNSNHLPVDDQEFKYWTLLTVYTPVRVQHRLSFRRQIVRYRVI